MKKIIKKEINGEEVYLKKGLLGWNVVHPIKNDDDTINWKNLIAGGSWIKLLMLGVLVLLMVLTIFEYVGNIKMLQSQAELCKAVLFVP